MCAPVPACCIQEASLGVVGETVDLGCLWVMAVVVVVVAVVVDTVVLKKSLSINIQ